MEPLLIEIGRRVKQLREEHALTQRQLAERAGLDFEHARLDRSLHPFCSGTPSDVRITMRYSKSSPRSSTR